MRRAISLVPVLAVILLLPSCKQVREKYFNALEKVGIEKRELLVKRVDNAREAQVEAQEQFKDALTQFQALVGYQGGDLEKMYDKLSSEYEASESKAKEVRERITKVEQVAQSLFEEWQREIGQFQNQQFKRESERELAATRQRTDQVVRAMKRSAATMDPVLLKLRDQVLFLKHNLNARALGSLSGTSKSLQVEVDGLITQMQNSIAEADKFIQEMRTAPRQ
jgi:hypothetical protein